MSKLTTQQRKLVYLIGIIILLVPIIQLSLPSDGTKNSSVGTLAKLRTDLDLGETDLGDVDPSGAAINLVLLGLRGVAVNMLWIEHDQQRDMKRWAEMQATTESIVRLQPHYEKVWDMHGWNLAYNTSMEWEAIPDRYYWVKQGAKLLKRGVARNRKSTELYYRTGIVLQQKIGNADESVEYKQYFLSDPDPVFKGGPDPEINPDGKDNYLAAKDWFLEACEREIYRPQHILDRTLFRAQPTRCQFDHAAGLQKLGRFGEETRAAWAQARQEWTDNYGREVFHAIIGSEESNIRLEMTPEDIKQEAKTPDDEPRIRRAVDQYQKMVNYRYWRMRGYAEAETDMAEAHRNFYEAKQAFKSQRFEEARSSAFAGLEGMDKILKQDAYKSLAEEDQLAEEILLGWKIWDDIHQLAQEKVPEDYPLKWFIDHVLQINPLVDKINKQFTRLLREGR